MDADVEVTWRALTDGVGGWWPAGAFSDTGDSAARVRFDGDRLVRRVGGVDHLLGHVIRWEPPFGVLLAWDPDAPGGGGGEVEWLLTPLAGDTTLVQVVHRDWAVADGDGGDGDDGGGVGDLGPRWAEVLAALAGAVDRDEPPAIWHVLTHTPGPAATGGAPPWEQPWFAGHAGFLDTLKADGALVAAGLLPSSEGSLRTVVRGLDSAEAVRRATEEDPTVVAGHLAVSVTPWLVIARGQLA